jgi:hypothetical protein
VACSEKKHQSLARCDRGDFGSFKCHCHVPKFRIREVRILIERKSVVIGRDGQVYFDAIETSHTPIETGSGAMRSHLQRKRCAVHLLTDGMISLHAACGRRPIHEIRPNRLEAFERALRQPAEIRERWCGWRGSNPRPLASEANTLSTELQPQCCDDGRHAKYPC